MIIRTYSTNLKLLVEIIFGSYRFNTAPTLHGIKFNIIDFVKNCSV